jgi:hypothetical protein
MRTKAGIRTIRRSKALMLAGATCLLLLPAAESQKPEHLTEHLHMTWVANWEVHNADVYSKSDSSDHITVELDATAHATAPAGTPPWQMNPTITAFHYAVSGNGSLAMTQKHEWAKGSWTWGLAEAPKDPSQIATLDNGSFSFTPFGLDELKIEPQGQVESGGEGVPTQSVPASNAATGVLAALPLVYAHVSVKSFYDQLSGTFDPNTKAFTKTGKASGSYSGNWSDGSLTGSVDAEYSLNFNQQPEDVEAILIPQKGYEQWMPQAGHDEDTPGNGLLVNVELQKKDKPGEKPRAKAKSFKFELTGVSKEPGVCLNWPPKEKTKQNPDFDLKIDKDANPGLQVAADGQSATATGDSQEGSVIVFSYDWGAWGSLKVTAELDNNQTVVAHLQNRPGVTELKIPKDDNGNHVADARELSWEPKDAHADSDVSPIGDHTGDTLSYYEEYRGFMVQGEHQRTNPNRKDVFIYDMNHLGLGYFPLSGMSTHVLRQDEYTWVPPSDPRQNGRVVNFNHGFAHLGDAHVLLLVNGPAPDDPGVLGEAVGGPGPPKMITGVYVNKAACMASWWGDLEVQSHIGHELAHGCNVPHHGDGDYEPDDFWMKGQDGKWYPMDTPGNHEVSVRQGQHSGTMQCIMRHYRSGYYEAQEGKYRWREPGKTAWIQGEVYGRADIPGDLFCTSSDGNPPNARVGPAAPGRGDCSEKFCVNDLKH